MPQCCGDPRVGFPVRPDTQQFAERCASILRRYPAFGQAGHDFDHAGLFPQVEGGARRCLRHPRDQRLEVAPQRIDIEERHPAPLDTQMVQAVGQDQHAAGCTIMRLLFAGSSATSSGASRPTARTAVAFRCGVSPNAGPRYSTRRAPPDQFRCRHCAHSQFLKARISADLQG